MTSKIFKSTVIVAAFVFVATLVLVISLIFAHYSDVQKEQLAEQAELVAMGTNEMGNDFVRKIQADGYRVTWIDEDGTVIYDSKADFDKMTDHSTREEVKQAMESGTGESSRYSSTMFEKEIYVAQKLDDGTVIRLAATQITMSGILLGILNQLIVVTFLTLILSFCIAYRLTKRIIDPLNKMDLDDRDTVPYEELRPLVDRIHTQEELIKEQTVSIVQKEAEREQAEMVRREFTANVTHELKTPLQTISGSAELLSKGVVKPEDVPRFSDKIYMESKRLITLVEDIISLSRIEEAGNKFRKERVDLYDIAKFTVRNLKPAAELNNTEIVLEGETVKIDGVPQLLESIVFNLLDNSIKYSGENGEVKISVTKKDDKAVLSVADNGIGIPEGEKERVFERFYRVDKSRSKNAGGTGLGLSIVKHAALIHDADIEITSMLGKGTIVKVLFPLQDDDMKES
ncbi:MAG: ATP-binding protein [Eubacterium sp.]|nr:ATP-binding protein [Eubacterium sp.]